jgi:hypothetical protein
MSLQPAHHQNILAPHYPEHFPLCVDLDGTLVKEHTLWHLNAHKKPGFLKNFFPFSWPLIKEKMAHCADLSTTRWTYHTRLIDCLRLWHAQGVRLYLVTGAPEKIAHHVADRLGLFSDVWASSSSHNLVGRNKGAHLCHQFGVYGYTYIGDTWKDRLVWNTSKDIITVGKQNSLLTRYLHHTKTEHQNVFSIPHDA